VCLVCFRKDFSAYHETILNDRFFKTLFGFPLCIAALLCIPLWSSTTFAFSKEGYETFLIYFDLPIKIVGLTATIAAAYGFHHTSKQKEREIGVVTKNIELQTATLQLESSNKYIISAGAITVLLIKITNNVHVLGQRLVGKGLLTASALQHDIDIIDTFWNSLYQEDRYIPSIISFNKQLQDMDGHMKGVILLAREIISSLESTQLTLNSETENAKSLEKKFIELGDKLRSFENEVVSFDKEKRESHEVWRLYSENLRQEIRQD
jgi:hypothetical protein